ncbi:head completion/stabilization protein [Acinetobacter sp. UGAL515B_02]|nr:head completion/stabilization protein [Acinetobacter sp. UGAL515B_02]WON80837.1 head completion/stabilization protein [Acinetobacter sp. UGAL515B_02]
MTDFSFNAPQSTSSEVISNDPFFPDVALEDVRQKVRFDGSVTNQRLTDSITAAMLEINHQLRTLKTKASSLNDLATGQIGGKANTQILYERAIHSAVAADINEKYRAYDSSSEGQKRGQELEPTVDDHRRNLRWAIRDLLGQSRCTVDLI